MEELAPLTNKERKDDVTFLLEAYSAGGHLPTDVLDAEERQRFLAGEAADQQEIFFKLLCYGVLAAQPAPESIVHADWLRLLGAGVLHDVFERRFDISRYALDPPVSRGDSKGKVIDFVRLSETRDAWARLPPEPAEPEVAVDVLYAASGGALKSRAFWVVREMRRYGLGKRPTSTISATCPTVVFASAPRAWAWSTCPRRRTRSPT